MNMFTNTKKTKKFILFLVLLMLFNFCCPNIVMASNTFVSFQDYKNAIFGRDWNDYEEEGTDSWYNISSNFARLLFYMERGIIGALNDMFCDEDAQYKYSIKGAITKQIDIDIFLTPENIIKGKFILFNADIFEDISVKNGTPDDKYYDDGNGNNAIVKGRQALREYVASWYYALRNFSIVALLSVLVYVGIRMIMSTIAQDKAKYKSMFKDWLVALCLVVIMHYIMIAILNMSSLVTEAIGPSGKAKSQTEFYMQLIGQITSSEYGYYYTDQDGIVQEDIRAFLDKGDGQYELFDIGAAYAYEFLLIAIIIFTVIFAIKYLKREFTIMFLILLGPISCITYPIDKISDGKAQAFNKWFSEFLYQVIIQPFHLLIYVVLVGSAQELANENIIYSLVCLATMIPAEKFIKEMFGFKDKLGSPLGAFAGGAMASQALQKIMNSRGGSSSGKVEKDNSGENSSSELPPKTVDKRELGGGESTSDGSNQTRLSNSNPQTQDRISDVGDQPRLPDGDSQTQDTASNVGDQASLLNGDSETQDGTSDTQAGQEDANANNPNFFQRRANEAKALGKAAWTKHEQRAAKKYGTTSRKQRWKRRVGKGLKAGAKGALKLGAIGTLGAAATATALATGNGKEALTVLGGIGAYGAKKAYDGGKKTIKGAVGGVKDYTNGLRNDFPEWTPFVKNSEEKAFLDFQSQPGQIDKAIASYKKRNDGKEPGYKELNEEMQDRFALSRYGLSDDQIDEAMKSYKELKANNISEEQALQQTAFKSQLGEMYKGKFGKEKEMQDAIQAVTKTFTDEGVEKEIAQKNAIKYLEGAAKIKGETMVLPSSYQTVDAQIPNVSGSLGLDTSTMSTDQIERMNSITFRLHEVGYTDNEIQHIAETSAGGNTIQAIERYETKVKFLTDDTARAEAKKYVAATSNMDVKNVTDKQINVEMDERSKLFDVGVKVEDLTGTRVIDQNLYAHHTESEKEMALKRAGKYSKGEMKSVNMMNREIESTAKELVKKKLVSDNGIKKATEIMERAATIKGTEIASKYTTGN